MISFTIDATEPLQHLDELAEKVRKMAEDQTDKDSMSWPLFVRAQLNALRERPSIATNTLSNAFTAESLKGKVNCYTYLRVNQAADAAPYWVSIEYGSVEAGKPADKEGMPVQPGWVKQVHMSTRGKGVIGRWTPPPSMPRRGLKNGKLITPGATGGLHFQNEDSSFSPNRYRKLRKAPSGFGNASVVEDGYQREGALMQAAYLFYIKNDIKPKYFVYRATKRQWQKTTEDLKRSFESMSLTNKFAKTGRR